MAMKQIVAQATPATQYQSLRRKRRNFRQYSSQPEWCLYIVEFYVLRSWIWTYVVGPYEPLVVMTFEWIYEIL